MSDYLLRFCRRLFEKKTFIEADVGVLTDEPDLYDLENIKRVYSTSEDKD